MTVFLGIKVWRIELNRERVSQTWNFGNPVERGQRVSFPFYFLFFIFYFLFFYYQCLFKLTVLYFTGPLIFEFFIQNPTEPHAFPKIDF